MSDRMTDPVSDPVSGTKTNPGLKDRILKEAALTGGLFLAGLMVLPLLIYLVGEAIFGAYEGGGYGAFYSRLHGEFRAGEPAVVFLLLAPYILWQLLRFTSRVFRRLRRVSGNPG